MSPRVLLIGGHGKISLLLTPKLLARSWAVTSVIRDEAQSKEILATGKGQPGKVNVIIRSLEDVRSEQQAQSVLDESKPDFVVWSAGAGGRGGSSRTYAIDRDAAIHFIRASIHTPSVTKFLMISYIGSRRNRPSWWTDADWAASQKINTEVLPDYYAAKIEADECLTALARLRGEGFQAIVLRPGSLTDDAETGRVTLGRTAARGKVARANVADVAVELLGSAEAKGWYDLLEGEEAVYQAVERTIKEKIDCSEGEDVDAMLAKYK